MPLFWAYSVKTDSATVEEIAAARDDHLRWQFENEKLGNLLGAGPVFDPDVDGPPVAGIYILVCNDAAEARARADTDPFHARGLREYTILRWRLNESAYMGVGLRAALNGDEPDNPHYFPPAG